MNYFVKNVEELREAAAKILPDGHSEALAQWAADRLMRHVAATSEYSFPADGHNRHGQIEVRFNAYGVFAIEAAEIRDFLHAFRLENPKKFAKLEKANWSQVAAGCRKWHAALAKPSGKALKRAARAGDGAGVRRVAEAPNGHYWLRLESAEALDVEGVRMGHCVGRGSYDTHTKMAPPAGIYSLRNAEGASILTAEVDEGGEARQIKRIQNSQIEKSDIESLAPLMGLGINISKHARKFGFYCIEGALLSKDEAISYIGNLKPNQVISGTLDLYALPFERLPEGLVVKGYLDVSLSRIKEIPKGLRVSRGLVANNCCQLQRVSNDVKIGGDAAINDCGIFGVIGAGFQIDGNFNLNHCDTIFSLPSDMSAGKSIVISHCKNLISISEYLTVHDDIALIACNNLEKISKRLAVSGSVIIQSCSKLKFVAEDIVVEGDVNLADSISLRELPERTHIGGYLNVGGCRNLKKLPENGAVAGWLNLHGSSIKEIPNGFVVGGDIHAADEVLGADRRIKNLVAVEIESSM
jgi:hypothetical protein